MTTLSRERRKVFEEIIRLSDIGKSAEARYESYGNDAYLIDVAKLAEALAAAALSRSERTIPGVEAAMFAGRKVTADDLDPTGEEAALKAFESAMHLPGNWQWYPGKSSDEAGWKDLRKFVVKTYRTEGAKAFEEYFTWSIQPYIRGAMTALSIKQNPGNFEASWAAFRASAMTKKTDEVRPEYKTYKPEEKKYVSRPEHIKPVFRKPSE